MPWKKNSISLLLLLVVIFVGSVEAQGFEFLLLQFCGRLLLEVMAATVAVVFGIPTATLSEPSFTTAPLEYLAFNQVRLEHV